MSKIKLKTFKTSLDNHPTTLQSGAESDK